jgi:hypothetical protein
LYFQIEKGVVEMKSFIIIIAAGVSVLFANVVSGQPDEKKKLQQLMQRKLKHAQKILEGIAVKDFEQIAESAAELTTVSKAAEFAVVKSPSYEILSNEFRRLTESLHRQGKEKNLDGAALSYVDLTLNCVKCHKYVREVRMTRATPGQQPAQATARRLEEPLAPQFPANVGAVASPSWSASPETN